MAKINKKLIKKPLDKPIDQVVAIKLPLQYDPTLLERDLEAVKHFQRISQPGQYHKGEWAGVSLFAPGGNWRTANPGARVEPFQQTDALKQTPYFQEVLDSLECEKQSVRLLWLPPGGKIGEHRDEQVGFNTGALRIHLPVVTNPSVVLMIGGQRCKWEAGELWFGDFSYIHSVENKGIADRVHIVMDLQINDFLLDLFPKEFIEKKKKQGLRIIPKPIEMSQEELKKYQCAFRIPKDKTNNEGPKDDAEISLVDDKLIFTVNGKPEMVLKPVSDTTFIFQGTASLYLQYDMSDGKPARVTFFFKKALPIKDYTMRLSVKPL